MPPGERQSMDRLALQGTDDSLQAVQVVQVMQFLPSERQREYNRVACMLNSSVKTWGICGDRDISYWI